MSEYSGYIRGYDSFLTDRDGFDTGAARDWLVNNSDHLLDEHTQVRVHWVKGKNQDPMTSQANSTSAYQLVGVFGPFPLTLISGGTPAELVVRLAGRASAAGTVTWRVQFAPWGQPSVAPGGTSTSDAVTEVSTTGTSYAWRDPSPQVMQVGSAFAELARATVASYATSTEPRDAEWIFAQAEIWALTSDAGVTPQLAGLYIREFVGN